ncbi:hypothetical protein GQ457_08G026700 [Hibiscus cannabinus]
MTKALLIVKVSDQSDLLDCWDIIPNTPCVCESRTHELTIKSNSKALRSNRQVAKRTPFISTKSTGINKRAKFRNSFPKLAKIANPNSRSKGKSAARARGYAARVLTLMLS